MLSIKYKLHVYNSPIRCKCVFGSVDNSAIHCYFRMLYSLVIYHIGYSCAFVNYIFCLGLKYQVICTISIFVCAHGKAVL